MADYNELFADEDFVVEHLLASPDNHALIESFSVGNDAMGLELFLTNGACHIEDGIFAAFGRTRTLCAESREAQV